MAFQRVPETAEAVLSIGSQGIIMTNTFYFRKTGGYGQVDIDDLAAAVDGWVGAHYRARLSAEATYFGTNVRGLDQVNDLTAVNTTSAGIGGVVGEILPLNVSFAIKRLSGLTGRSARGRIFVPGIPTSQLDANENFVLATYADGNVDALNELKIDAALAGWQEVIVSRFENNVKRPLGVLFVVVNYAYTDLIVDTQRGRLP